MMHSTKSFLGPLLFIQLISISTGTVYAESGNKIRFTFAPDNNISFIQKVTTKKIKETTHGGKQVDKAVSVNKMTITKTQSGWDVLYEPQSISMTRNGKPVENPMLKLLSSAMITYKLDQTGKLVDIEGYGTFVDALSKKLPPKVFEQLKLVLSADALKAKETVEWNGRIGDYLGVEVSIGDRFVADVPFQLPNGEKIQYKVNTTITKRTRCGQHECVRIDQTYDSLASNVAKMTGDMVNKMTESLAPGKSNGEASKNTASIIGSIRRIIDPGTMLIYREDSSRVIDMSINVPNVGMTPVKMIEIKSYTYQY